MTSTGPGSSWTRTGRTQAVCNHPALQPHGPAQYLNEETMRIRVKMLAVLALLVSGWTLLGHRAADWYDTRSHQTICRCGPRPALEK